MAREKTDGSEVDAAVAITTVANASDAEKLGRALVAARLAACVSIVPGVRSIYQWEGRICDEAELLLLIKTTRPSLEELESMLQQIHPYDVPELLIVDVDSGAAAYLEWLAASTART